MELEAEPLIDCSSAPDGDCNFAGLVYALGTANALADVADLFCPCLAVVNANPGLVARNLTVKAACDGGRRLQEKDQSPPPSVSSEAAGATSSLGAFLGQRRLEQLQEDLDELGVEEVADFKELEQEDIDRLAAKLKKAQARKFVKKIAAL